MGLFEDRYNERAAHDPQFAIGVNEAEQELAQTRAAAVCSPAPHVAVQHVWAETAGSVLMAGTQASTFAQSVSGAAWPSTSNAQPPTHSIVKMVEMAALA